MAVSRKFRWFVAVAVAAAFVPARAAADDGSIDASFRGGAWVYQAPTSSLTVRSAVDAEGRLLIGYTAELAGSDTDMRMLPVPDAGFTSHCASYAPDLGGTDADSLSDMVVDGNRLYLAGVAAGPVGDEEARAAIGAFDLANNCQQIVSFGGDDGLIVNMSVSLDATAIVASDDGGIRVGGQYYPGGSDWVWLEGFDDQGALAVGFDGQILDPSDELGLPSFLVSDMVRQPDGKLIVVGTTGQDGGDHDVGVVRFEADGDLDPAFSGDGIAGFSYDVADSGDDTGAAVGLLPDGRIAIGGSVERETGNQAAVAILTPSGNYFNAFGVIGRYAFDFAAPDRIDRVNAIAVQGDGRIVVAGMSRPDGATPDGDFGVARLLSTGSSPLDVSFHADGRRTVAFNEGGTFYDVATDVTLGQGGRITVVGLAQYASDFGVAAVRLNNDYIFVDGFEWGYTQAWSVTPAP